MIDRRSFIKSFGFGLAAVTVAPVVVLKTVVKPSAPPIGLTAEGLDRIALLEQQRINNFYLRISESMTKCWRLEMELMKHTPLDTIIDEIKKQNPETNLDIDFEWKTEYYEQS